MAVTNEMTRVPAKLPSEAVADASLLLAHRAGSPLSAVLAAARRIGSSGAHALISGEPGTGTEDLARVVHATRLGEAAPFLTVQCGARDERALLGLLLGQAGAGALRSLRDLGGTVHFDDVAELSWDEQARVARALAGDPEASLLHPSTGVRVVATTSRELLAAVEAGTFRRELYDAVPCSLHVPPLRERRGDVLAVADRAWAAMGERRVIAHGARELLTRYAWPGNARQVVAFMQRLATNGGPAAISARDVERELFTTTTGLSCWAPPEPTPPLADAAIGCGDAASATRQVLLAAGLRYVGEDRVDLVATLRAVEAELIEWALTRTGGCRSTAAALLGIRRTTLVEKLRKRRELAEAAAPAPEVPHLALVNPGGGTR